MPSTQGIEQYPKEVQEIIRSVKPLKEGVYQECVIMLGFIMHEHEDKMGIENLYNLKMAQATVCQLGLEYELETIKKNMKGE